MKITNIMIVSKSENRMKASTTLYDIEHAVEKALEKIKANDFSALEDIKDMFKTYFNNGLDN